MLRTLVALAAFGMRTPVPLDAPVATQYGGANRDFVYAKSSAMSQGEATRWRRPLGQGTSGIVSDGKTLFTMYSVPEPKDTSRGEEVVIALDAATGKTVWEYRYPVARLKGQESYTNEGVRPQATPALHQGRLCTLGYAGVLNCFEAASGKVLWQTDLVKEFEATPVQFGFSASPLVYRDSFLVHVGGKRTALVSLRCRDGAVQWKAEAAEPSYASPVLMRVRGEDQCVQVTRDAIFGFSMRDGSRRWRYPMPMVGLTNVPTPIVLPGERLLVSGQGINGTRLLQIKPDAKESQVAEVWKNEKVKFFYSNWVTDNQAVYGCVSAFIGALDLTNGKELWRERGQAEGNLIRIGEEMLVARGDSLVTLCRMSKSALTTGGSFQALQGRCWTAPTLLGDTLYLRDDAEITAVRLSALVKK